MTVTRNVISKVSSRSSKNEIPIYDLLHDAAQSHLTKSWEAAVKLKSELEFAVLNWHSLSVAERNAMLVLGVNIPTEELYAYAIAPMEYVKSIVGDFIKFPQSSDQKLTYVPSWMVIGASWRGHRSITAVQARTLVNDFEQAAIDYNTASCSLSNWLSPLPIVWAGEGKNRIRLYRDHNLGDMLTWLDKAYYPEPSKLVLRKVFNSNNWVLENLGMQNVGVPNLKSIFALQRNQYLLPFPSYSLPFLKAYGVEEGEKIFIWHSEKKRIEMVRELLTRSLRS